MTVIISQTATAIGPSIQASFLGAGGTAPYLYEVLPGGAGGTIDPSTGVYVAPQTISINPKEQIDIIQVTDYIGDKALSQILVVSPIQLVAEIFQREMSLGGRVWLWDQKINQPKDSLLYMVLTLAMPKIISNNNRSASAGEDAGLNAEQYTTSAADIYLDLYSRGPYAMTRLLEAVRVLKSDYCQRQMSANSFFVAPTPYHIMNFSNVDGAAIPYHYRIMTRLHYLEPAIRDTAYFDTFSDNLTVNT